MNVDNMISINDAPKLIATMGENITVILEGEPGIGKSSVLPILHELMGKDKYHAVYVDCPVVGDGDLVMRVPNRETGRLETYLSDLFPQDGKPYIIMLDEFLKVNKLMKTMFTRLMLERVLGDYPLPDGSIVFATSNLRTDGVGDTIEGHVGNRVMRVPVRKANHKEYLNWLTNNGASTVLRALVSIKPSLCASYVGMTPDRLNDNPYIYNPTSGNNTYASPRSMFKADSIIKQAKVLGERLTRIALIGTVGEAAAELFNAFIMMEKDLTPIEMILKDPEVAVMPNSAGAVLMTLFNGVDVIETQDELGSFMKFVNRIDNTEFKDVFMSSLCETSRTTKLAFNNQQIMKWYQDNYKIISA